MILYPNAKINLGLNVVEKRKDAYHNIESVFYPIPLKDELKISKSDALAFTSSGILLDSEPENNLVLKAYNLLKSQYSLSEVRLHLHKTIPFGGGLGGGSADASFCLKGLNELFNLNLKAVDLKALSAEIGADCPFFIDNKPSFVSGIGDKIDAIDLDLSGYFLVLVKPDIAIPTPLAYKNVEPVIPSKSIRAIIKEPIKTWKDHLHNDFEDSVFKSFPQLKEIKSKLYQNGALYASMSGSGSTFYGLFKDVVSLKNNFKDMLCFECKL